MDYVTIWDGVEFQQMERKEAEKLQEQNRLQILSDGFIDGLSLKHTHEFAQYKTREMTAEKPDASVVKKAKKKAPAKKSK